MSVPQLDEVPERSAPGEIAAIYASLRAALGVPIVNLVFRHMATVDGCLPWAWGCLEPIYRGGAIHEAGARMAMLAQQIGISRGVNAGLRTEAIGDTLTAYIRANPINMMGLCILERLLDGRAAVDVMPPGGPARVKPITQLLPLADLGSVPPRSLEKLTVLANMLHGPVGSVLVIPSLFRHFAAWPTALDTIDQSLHELIEAGTLDIVARDMEAYGKRVADRLEAKAPWPADEATTACIRNLVGLFPANMTKMTVVAIALRDVLT